MTDSEKQIVQNNIEKAKRFGVKVVRVASLVRRINPVQDFSGFMRFILANILRKARNCPHPFVQGRYLRTPGCAHDRRANNYSYTPRACLLWAFRPFCLEIIFLD